MVMFHLFQPVFLYGAVFVSVHLTVYHVLRKLSKVVLFGQYSLW